MYTQAVEVRNYVQEIKKEIERQGPFIFFSQSTLQMNLMDQKNAVYFFFHKFYEQLLKFFNVPATLSPITYNWRDK